MEMVIVRSMCVRVIPIIMDQIVLYSVIIPNVFPNIVAMQNVIGQEDAFAILIILVLIVVNIVIITLVDLVLAIHWELVIAILIIMETNVMSIVLMVVIRMEAVYVIPIIGESPVRAVFIAIMVFVIMKEIVSVIRWIPSLVKLIIMEARVKIRTHQLD